MTYEITPNMKSDKRDITSPCCNATYKYRKANTDRNLKSQSKFSTEFVPGKSKISAIPAKLNFRENFMPQGNYIVPCV